MNLYIYTYIYVYEYIYIYIYRSRPPSCHHNMLMCAQINGKHNENRAGGPNPKSSSPELFAFALSLPAFQIHCKNHYFGAPMV